MTVRVCDQGQGNDAEFKQEFRVPRIILHPKLHNSIIISAEQNINKDSIEIHVLGNPG